MSEDNITRNEKGEPIDVSEVLFEDWQIKLFKKLREWFPKSEGKKDEANI